jgi:hypothetical protein
MAVKYSTMEYEKKIEPVRKEKFYEYLELLFIGY